MTMAMRANGFSAAAAARSAGLGAALAWAAALLPTVGRAETPEITVALDPDRSSCGVRASFSTPADPAIAWAVLTDYDSIPRFVKSVRTSRSERTSDGQLQVRQEAVGGLFLFKRRQEVLLEIDEDPDSSIRFRDVLGEDFRSYVGRWRISADSVGTRVEYELDAEPRAAVVRAFCRGVLRKTAQDLLAQVRAEIMRRAAGSDSAAAEDGGAPAADRRSTP
jgi:hypothetical protein